VTPADLRTESFDAYPPLARKVATERIELLRVLPLAFLPLLLRELIAYDWKFPAERRDMDRQLAYLTALSMEERNRLLSAFVALRLSKQIQDLDWVNAPSQFSEQLTSELWSSHQIDSFRSAAVDYMAKFQAAAPENSPDAARLGICVIGEGVRENGRPLFRKLRPHGVYYSRVRTSGGLAKLLEAAQARAASRPGAYSHWYIDGGTAPAAGSSLTVLSYGALTSVRSALQRKIQGAFESGMSPETLRTLLAETTPKNVGLDGGDGVMNHFQVSLLTEGSGTQIFATTFVQWAAREALRRAQPLTLVARFAPRQRERAMSELLQEARSAPVADPEGSLIDADMGAYYTWLNLQRLPGAEKSAFLVWFEDHADVMAIAPGLPRGKESAEEIELADILRRVA